MLQFVRSSTATHRCAADDQPEREWKLALRHFLLATSAGIARFDGRIVVRFSQGATSLSGTDMIDDATLLRRYAAEKSNEAFAELVRRHLPLVYASALRRLAGDTHAAEDVAQAVFSAVARKAHRLAAYSSLTGWLYLATRNAAVNTIRVEHRRRIREQEAHTMQETAFESETPANWSELRPVLDRAMDQLGERDREAVLLRFFEARPFAEIGRTLGLSEEAARKRVERALDTLRARLRLRGIGSTSTALATLLASQTLSAAPATLAPQITGAALATAGATTAGFTAFLTTMKIPLGLAATVLVGTVVLITQQRSVSAQRADPAARPSQLTTPSAGERMRGGVAEVPQVPVRAGANGLEAAAGTPLATTPTPPDGSRLAYGVPVRSSGSREGFYPGDHITITAVIGDRPRIEPGGTYRVEGAFALASAPSATLALSLTASGPNGYGAWSERQQIKIARGSGTFSLVATMRSEGKFHVSFYFADPSEPGRSSAHGGVYFENP
jgi:RNA polymerase sigma factor (sigma-70 family)